VTGDTDISLVSSRLERGDVNLHVVASRGDRHERRAPVLFLHGYPDTHATWSHQLEGLASMHPVAAYDMRGVGDSSAPVAADGQRIARYLDDIEAVIDRVAGPEGQVHLVGHDWGGALGWLFAADPARAARLRSYTAIAAPHAGSAVALFRERLRRHNLADLALLAGQLRRSWYIFLFQIPRLPELYLGREPAGMWVRTHRAGGMQRGDPELTNVDPARARRQLVTPLALYRQMFAPETIAELRAGPRSVDVPTCVIVPLRDLALVPELYDHLPEFVPDLEMHRIDDNHWLHRTSATEVNQILHDFVARHDA
jgi:pimeloyl-ACP methyl ester carboxylesterase